MKKLLFLILLLAGGALAFFGLFKVPTDSVYVLDSKFRGKKMALPNEWVFYPESVVPGIFQLKKFPAEVRFYHKKDFDFPYSRVIDYFRSFKIEVFFKVHFEVGFSVEYLFHEKNIAVLYEKNDVEALKKEIILKVEDMISSIISQNLNNPEFSKDALLDTLKKESDTLGFKIHFTIISFPL